MVLVVVLGCAVLVVLGGLVGWSLAVGALAARSRRQAMVQQRLNVGMQLLSQYRAEKARESAESGR